MEKAICIKCNTETEICYIIRTEIAYYCVNCFDKHNIDILEKPPIQLALFQDENQKNQ